jgi:predicted HD superfamily hydrolase involved in NAD metabolism
VTKEEILEKMKKNLSPSRIEHILRVVDTAQLLAERYGVDPDRAEWAALLHDFYKWQDKEAYAAALEASGLALDKETAACQELSHGWMAADFMQSTLGIEDEEIYYAIATHTTGRSGMSLLEKVMYLADRVEPGRTHPGSDRLRSMAFQDLDRAVYIAMNQTLEYLLKNHSYIHPRTIEARNDLWRNITERTERIEG